VARVLADSSGDSSLFVFFVFFRLFLARVLHAKIYQKLLEILNFLPSGLDNNNPQDLNTLAIIFRLVTSGCKNHFNPYGFVIAPVVHAGSVPLTPKKDPKRDT
jgi:hypothetical protein